MARSVLFMCSLVVCASIACVEAQCDQTHTLDSLEDVNAFRALNCVSVSKLIVRVEDDYSQNFVFPDLRAVEGAVEITGKLFEGGLEFPALETIGAALSLSADNGRFTLIDMPKLSFAASINFNVLNNGNMDEVAIATSASPPLKLSSDLLVSANLGEITKLSIGRFWSARHVKITPKYGKVKELRINNHHEDTQPGLSLTGDLTIVSGENNNAGLDSISLDAFTTARHMTISANVGYIGSVTINDGQAPPDPLRLTGNLLVNAKLGDITKVVVQHLVAANSVMVTTDSGDIDVVHVNVMEDFVECIINADFDVLTVSSSGTIEEVIFNGLSSVRHMTVSAYVGDLNIIKVNANLDPKLHTEHLDTCYSLDIFGNLNIQTRSSGNPRIESVQIFGIREVTKSLLISSYVAPIDYVLLGTASGCSHGIAITGSLTIKTQSSGLGRIKDIRIEDLKQIGNDLLIHTNVGVIESVVITTLPQAEVGSLKVSATSSSSGAIQYVNIGHLQRVQGDFTITTNGGLLRKIHTSVNLIEGKYYTTVGGGSNAKIEEVYVAKVSYIAKLVRIYATFGTISNVTIDGTSLQAHNTLTIGVSDGSIGRLGLVSISGLTSVDNDFLINTNGGLIESIFIDGDISGITMLSNAEIVTSKSSSAQIKKCHITRLQYVAKNLRITQKSESNAIQDLRINDERSSDVKLTVANGLTIDSPAGSVIISRIDTVAGQVDFISEIGRSNLGDIVLSGVPEGARFLSDTRFTTIRQYSYRTIRIENLHEIVGTTQSVYFSVLTRGSMKFGPLFVNDKEVENVLLLSYYDTSSGNNDPACINRCDGHGTATPINDNCNHVETCVCFPGWEGDDCDIEVVVDECSVPTCDCNCEEWPVEFEVVAVGAGRRHRTCDANAPIDCTTVELRGEVTCEFDQFEESPPTPTTHRICSDLTVCSADQFEQVPPTETSDRVCGSLIPCTGDEYIVNAPTPTSNWECDAISECEADQYLSSPATYTSDNICTSVTTCGSSQYLRTPATATSDNECEPCTTDCPLGIDTACSGTTDTVCLSCGDVCSVTQYEDQSCSTSSPRICKDCRVCESTEYLSAPCTPKSNAVCKSYSTCDENEYESVAPTVTSDRTCTLATICSEGEYVVSDKTATSDRECGRLTECLPDEQFEEEPPTETSNRVCRDVRVCDDLSFTSANPTATSDRKCSPYTICTATQFIIVKATPTSDRKCKDLLECNASQYEDTTIGSLQYQNRVCKPLTGCDSDTQFERIPPQLDADRKCANVSACVENVQYERSPPEVDADRDCRNFTQCGSDEYIIKSPTATSDRLCFPYEICEPGEWELESGTTTSDRKCVPWKTCDPGTVEVEAPTLTSDRKCGVLSDFCKIWTGTQYVSPCLNNANCTNTPDGNGNGFTCGCTSGFGGTRCQFDSSICEGYCFNNGACVINFLGDPSCNCRSGFDGTRCGTVLLASTDDNDESNSPSDSSGGSDSSLIPIIAGVVAGVFLLIAFLAFRRRQVNRELMAAPSTEVVAFSNPQFNEAAPKKVNSGDVNLYYDNPAANINSYEEPSASATATHDYETPVANNNTDEYDNLPGGVASYDFASAPSTTREGEAAYDFASDPNAAQGEAAYDFAQDLPQLYDSATDGAGNPEGYIDIGEDVEGESIIAPVTSGAEPEYEIATYDTPNISTEPEYEIATASNVNAEPQYDTAAASASASEVVVVPAYDVADAQTEIHGGSPDYDYASGEATSTSGPMMDVMDPSEFGFSKI